MTGVVARGVCRDQGGRRLIDRIDLELAPGEVVGLVGPNGGGKTTLLLLLAGLVRPTAGEVRIEGVPADQLAHAATGAVGLITAEPGLYPLLTGRENLRFFGGLYGRPADEVDARSAPLLRELEVDDAVLDQRSAGYSSGTRQKVSLARALLLDPKVLLLDEPTSNLDPLSARIVHEAVRARADAGVAVVLATHDLHAAEHICDRVVAVARGRVVDVVRLEGERRLPPAGRLLGLWQEAAAGEGAPREDAAREGPKREVAAGDAGTREAAARETSVPHPRPLPPGEGVVGPLSPGLRAPWRFVGLGGEVAGEPAAREAAAREVAGWGGPIAPVTPAIAPPERRSESPARRVAGIARREWLEQGREPWMLMAVGALYGVVAALFVVAVAALDWLDGDPFGRGLVRDWLATTPGALVASALVLFDFLVFTQFLGIAAVASGQAVLHDRQCGTLTFLLLAPIRRFELLLGKVLGALGWPFVLYLIIDGTAAGLLAATPIARVHRELLPLSPVFFAGFLLGAPAWAACVGAVGTVVSSLARDVRTAQQSVWFVVFFATLLAGGLLTWGLGAGLAAELAVAALGACGAAAVLVGGASALSRDLGR